MRVAPFHLLASEGAAHADKPLDWRMASSGEPAERVMFDREGDAEAAVAWR